MHKNTIVAFISKYYFSFILAIFFFYSLLLIINSSFVVNGLTYFSLFDDMMISMRYGYNLAHSHELVWNQGLARVEGFSNPLWTLYMTVIHLLPIPAEKTSSVIQFTGLLVSLGTLYYVRAISAIATRDSRFAIITSLLFTAFYFPLNNWSIVQGTEVSLLTFMVTACTYLVIQSIVNRKFSLMIFFLMGVGIWIRLDFGVAALVLILMLLIFDSRQRLKVIFHGIPLFLFFLIAQVGLRWIYYHDILPNTYYLKMSGYPYVQRITRGIYVTLKELNLVILLVPFIFAFITKNKNILIILAVFTTQFFYSMYVGGDAWEQFGGTNRYVSIVMPLFFIALAATVNDLRDMIKKKRLMNYAKYRRIEIIVLVFIFILFNSASDNMLLYLLQLKPFPTKYENAFQVSMAKGINQITVPYAKVGIVQAGVVPYFSIDRIYIDLLGKSERVIARGISHEGGDPGRPLQKYLSFWPGHTKYDYNYVVIKLQPDIFGQVFPSSELVYLVKDYKRHTTQEGYVFYLRKDSAKLQFKTLDK